MASSLVDLLLDPARPVFLFGSTPPREGTSRDEQREIAVKWSSRSWVLASDGFIVYDIQDEAGRTTDKRPFPFRQTVDPSAFGGILQEVSSKPCLIYRSSVTSSKEALDQWLDRCRGADGHAALNLVGAATSKPTQQARLTLPEAADMVNRKAGLRFGCVCIAERHLKKGTEHENMMRKAEMGAGWFVSQSVFDAEATIKMLNDYGDGCKARGLAPKKVVLTFAPCGRRKTMQFIKWLGVKVPETVEQAIFSAENPTQASIEILTNLLVAILRATAGSRVPLSLNVESVSIVKEEIDGAHTLFQSLQKIMLDHHGRNWAVHVAWSPVDRTTPPRPEVSTATAVSDSTPSIVLAASVGAVTALLVLLGLRPKLS